MQQQPQQKLDSHYLNSVMPPTITTTTTTSHNRRVGWVRKKGRDLLEILCMASLVLSIPSYFCTFLLCCAFPPFWPLIVGYVAFIWCDKSPENGNAAIKYSNRFRSLFVWKYFASYFPITLHKTVDLPPAFEPIPLGDSLSSSSSSSGDEDDLPYRVHEPPSTRMWKWAFWWYYYFHSKPGTLEYSRPTGRRYIFGYHPHGIISLSAVGSIATEGAGWSEMFPGIPTSVLTLANQFVIPFYREMLMAMGMGSVSKRNCEALLNKNQSIAIIVGGAQESLFARPGCLDLVLNKRKGFIKLALETAGDISLVPVLAFGENDMYEQVRNDKESWLFNFQQLLKSVLGFTLPLLHARGVFNYDVGIMPYRRPINVVVGEPIAVPFEPKATAASVEKYHKLYVNQLESIYHRHKHEFCKVYNGKKPEFRIIE